MKHSIAIIVWILNCFILSAQSGFSRIDEFARNYKSKTTDVDKLASDLTSGYNEDLDKVRSIFVWITQNIQYDYKEYRRILKGKRESYQIVAGSEKELAEKKKRLDEERYKTSVKNTLSKRKGVCQDYSELFNSLCKSVHIRSGMIDGSIKDISGQFIPDNHAWNWVEIKGKTYLLDATWASGYVDDSKGKYFKEFNDGFFLTPPAMFVVNHFPNDSRWQLLNDKVTLDAFKEFPAVGQGFFKYKVKSFSPKVSRVSLKGNQLAIGLKFGVNPKVLRIANNGLVIKEYKKVDDDFYATLDLKKNRNSIDIWGDSDLIISYKTK
ncbi:MAG TPA: transglutaminase domain-containing protein [Bacteroidales bacterium]